MKSVQFYEESLQLVMSRKGKEAKRETALTLNRLGSLTRELGRYDEVCWIYHDLCDSSCAELNLLNSMYYFEGHGLSSESTQHSPQSSHR